MKKEMETRPPACRVCSPRCHAVKAEAKDWAHYTTQPPKSTKWVKPCGSAYPPQSWPSMCHIFPAFGQSTLIVLSLPELVSRVQSSFHTTAVPHLCMYNTLSLLRHFHSHHLKTSNCDGMVNYGKNEPRLTYWVSNSSSAINRTLGSLNCSLVNYRHLLLTTISPAALANSTKDNNY